MSAQNPPYPRSVFHQYLSGITEVKQPAGALRDGVQICLISTGTRKDDFAEYVFFLRLTSDPKHILTCVS